MSNCRITQALAAGRLVVTNKESVGVSLFIQTNGSPGSTPVCRAELLRPGQTLNITNLCTVEDIRKNKTLQDTLVRRNIQIESADQG